MAHGSLLFKVQGRTGFGFPLSAWRPVFLVLALIFAFAPSAHSAEKGPGMKLTRLGPESGMGRDAKGQKQNRQQIPRPESDAESFEAQQRRELCFLINQLRQRYNLAPLRYSDLLEAVARNHSYDMARHNFVSHTGSDGSSPRKRMLSARYKLKSGAENIAVGLGSPEAVLKAWMRSSGHRANLLNGSFREFGVGYVYAMNNNPHRHIWTLQMGSK
jgi:uncharacterized protein YkwD